MAHGQPRARTRSGVASVTIPGTSASMHVDDANSSDAPRNLIGEMSLPHSDIPHSWHPLAEDLQLRSGDAKVDDTETRNDEATAPPSFAALEFETIVRRLKNGAAFKQSRSIPKFAHLEHDWEFAGWGSLRYVDVTQEDLAAASANIRRKSSMPKVGQFRATSVAGNAVFGSVFYSIPAITAAAGVLSPLCMVFSCLTFLLYKPVMAELGSAIRLNGANYMYLLNFAGKSLALLGAAVTLIDALSTGITSAATAASYIEGEVPLPFPAFVLALFIIIVFSALLLLGIRESTGVTLVICAFHCLTILALVIAAVVHWARTGSDLITANWQTIPASPSAAAKAVFNGICIGVLGVTGFESTPTYIEQIRPAAYNLTLRNLVWGAFAFNLPTLLLVFACLSMDEVESGANILALLADRVAGKWLRYIVVVDAVISLCGGVLTGGVAVTGLTEKLAYDRAIPLVFHRPLLASAAYLGLSAALYAATGFSLPTVSNVFSMGFMATMLTYTVSAVLLKVKRNALRREFRARLATILLAMVCACVVILNIIINDQSILYTFGAALVIVLAGLLAYQNVAGGARWALYGLDNLSWIRRRARTWGSTLIRVIRQLKQREVCVWVKSDDISSLMEAVLYVRENEQTAKLLLVHAYDSVNGIPSELEANTKLLDEAFPSITVDLVLVHGEFSPELLLAVSNKISVPLSLNFLSGPRGSHLADYGGARIIKM